MPHTPRRREHDRLDASVFDRLTTRPEWARTILLRRIAAGILAAVGVVVFVRDSIAQDHVHVVVAARDLAPGVPLAADDVAVREFSPATVPDGAASDAAGVLSHTVAGPVRAGEPLTDVRLLSSRLANATIDLPDARVVPVRLSDAGVTDLLRSGDTVDVLTVGDGDGAARMLATGAVVVLVSPPGERQRAQDRVVLVAMSAQDATAVAAASLTSALTVTFR